MDESQTPAARDTVTQRDDEQFSGQPADPGTNPIHRPVPDDKEVSESKRDAATMPSDEPRRLAARDSSPVVKICKTCMTSRRDAGDFCVECGCELEPIRAVQDTCVGDVVGDKYTIVEQIGAGGMGQVYLGLNEPLGQRVAIKFLNEKFTSDEEIVLRFLNEARSYCKVGHPNAVTLLEYGQHDNGALYLITEYVEGQDLTELVDEKGPLPIELLVSIGLQLCEVLSAAHDQEVIHRDLKPDNLMLMPGSRDQYALKVLDFGIAKIADDNVDGPMTETGSVFGTPEFMSPEQARGKEADPRTDLYALGVILYFMATGRLPFTGDSKFTILNQQLHDDPQPPSKVVDRPLPAGLEELIFDCLQKSPDDRPDEAADIAERLDDIGHAAADRTETSLDEALEEAEETSTQSTRILDGPAADDTDGAVRGLDDTLFDDDGEATVDISLNGELISPDSALELPFDDGRDDSARGVGTSFETSESSQEEWTGEFEDPGTTQIPVSGSSDGPGRLRAAAVGLAATLAVVGGVVVWTVAGDADPDSSQVAPGVVAQQAAETADEARFSAAMGTVDVLLEDGALSDADSMLESVDTDGLTTDQTGLFDERVQRTSRAQNTDMQIRSAVDARDCETARSLMARLEELSTGGADQRADIVDNCSETDHRDDVGEPTEDEPAAVAQHDSSPAIETDRQPEEQAPSTAETEDADEADSPAEAEIAQPEPEATESTPEPTAETEPDDDSVEVAAEDDTDRKPTDETDDTDAVGDASPSDTGAAPGAEATAEDDAPATDDNLKDEEPEIAEEPSVDSDDETEPDEVQPDQTDDETELAEKSDDEPDDDQQDDVALPPSRL